MRISEEQYYELIHAVVHEGDPSLILAPLSNTPTDVPAEWAPLLTAPDPRAGIAILWQPVTDRLPRIYRGLQERLRGVGLLRTNEMPASLVYFFSDGEEWIPFRGRPPLPERVLQGSPLPKEFLEFYRIHDGWVHYYSEDSGPLPSAAWRPMSSLWTEVVWKLPPGDQSYEAAIAVYRESDDFALAYDTSASPALPLRCYSDGSVDVLLDMWAAIDREIGELLEELDWGLTASARRRRFHSDVPRAQSSRYQELIARSAECHTLAAHLGGGGADEQVSDLLLNCALLEREGAGDRDTVVEYYRNALRHWCASIDLGGDAGPEEVLNWFGVAHALGDTATAHFIASLPITIWADDSPEELQARALFCLYLGDAEHASNFVDELLGVTFSDESTPEPDAEITASLLQALSKRDAGAFASWRQKAVDKLCKATANQRALLPWTLRLRGFDGVASRLGINRGSSPHGNPTKPSPDP